MLENFLVYSVLAILSLVNIIVPISGSATVTPFIAILTEPHLAIGLASFYFLLGSIARVYMFRKDIKYDYVRFLLPISIIFAAFGALVLVKISPAILLSIILLFTLYFFCKKLKQVFGKEEKKPINRLSVHAIGVFSGFLQGSGLAGSDLRNSYLYSEKLTIAQVHGTTAIIGASNFLIATMARLYTDQLTIPNLIPLLYVFPFIILGTWAGKKILYKINRKNADRIIILVMCLIITFLILKILGV